MVSCLSAYLDACYPAADLPTSEHGVMADDPAVWLSQLRGWAGGAHLRDWQVFPKLAERLRQGDIADAAAVADVVQHLVVAHPDAHLRRWGLVFLGLVAELRPELADSALATLLAVIAGEWPWESPVPPALWDAAVTALTDLAVRLPALVLPHRPVLIRGLDRSGQPPYGLPVSRILDGLRQGLIAGLRHRTVRSTPKLLDEATDEARFAIWEKDRFHTARCPHLLRQVGVRLVPLSAMAEAAQYGFQPCASCHTIGKDGTVTGKTARRPAKRADEPAMPPPPMVTLGRLPYAEDPWQPPEPRPALDLATVPPPSAYARLTLLSQDQQAVLALWVRGELKQLSDVYRVIYARHHATLLAGAHAHVGLAALERAVTGLPKDAWCAAQLVMAAAVAAYRQGDAACFARVLAQRPETVFDYPFLVHLHGELAVTLTPELLFALRRLSGTRSSATITKRWEDFRRHAADAIARHAAEHGEDPVRTALKQGKGRQRLLGIAFGREMTGEVRFVDGLHGLPLARVTGGLLQGVLAAMKPVTSAARRAHRQAEERATLEALHQAPNAGQAIQALIAGISVGPGAGRIVAEQGMRAFETGDMIKATAYLAKALAVSPDMPGALIFRRALDRAAAAAGVTVAGLVTTSG